MRLGGKVTLGDMLSGSKEPVVGFGFGVLLGLSLGMELGGDSGWELSLLVGAWLKRGTRLRAKLGDKLDKILGMDVADSDRK